MEILEECRKIVSNGNNKELVEKTEYSDNFIKAMIETDNFNILYNMLDDEYSKELFKKIIRYRYMLAFYPEVHQNIKKEIMFSLKYGTISTYKWLSKMISFLIFKRMSLPKEIGAFALFHIFDMKQYDVKDVFEVNNDSVVFDIGAWKGDSAYFFSKKCSNDAKIYAFEPDANAYEALKCVKEKYKLNNVILENVLLSNKEETIDFVSMIPNTPVVKMNAVTVDKFVNDNNIDRIDYIKMDVEGAEQHILEGAKETIKKFRPSLAIAVYHGGKLFMEDFYKVPIFVKEITEGYKYYIRTFSPWGGETILFCKPR
ncbi:FkbM family methyltransferase [Brachyspira alvinipulli]|uniref:FkbM family methyltransferase n=1 Tax=Brachyspira alvinipulli TaxID=84379 RepID=UPI0026280AFD|nr:FkbM family methyltransferase [uncultured Brachyspira sp.]